MRRAIENSNTKSFVVIVCSFLLIPFWGVSFLSAGDVNSFTAFNGLLFTFLGASYLRREWATSTNVNFYLVGPMIYLIVALVIQRGDFLQVAAPLITATALLLLAVLGANLKFAITALMAVVFSAIYAFLLFNP